MKKIIFSLIISAFILPSISFAHPGRTDSSGGHTCRTNCANWGLSTGEYHYHRSKGVPQTKEPVRSIRNEGGVGQTVPAPEYKIPVNTVNAPTINTTPSYNPPSSYWTTTTTTSTSLRRGSSGDKVKKLQNQLIKKGYLKGISDGKFGPITLKAVKFFQADNGFIADGVVGPITKEALNK